MIFYIIVIIFHNQHKSNQIIYDLVITPLTYCFLNISHDALGYCHM